MDKQEIICYQKNKIQLAKLKAIEFSTLSNKEFKTII